MRWPARIGLLLLAAPHGAAQSTIPAFPDSVRRDTVAAPRDSLARRGDTTAVSGVDTVVHYSSADSIVYALTSRTMELHRNATLRYRDMELRSERVDINWNPATMNAFGVPDTADTTRTRMTGTPVMKDGGEEYHGHDLTY